MRVSLAALGEIVSVSRMLRSKNERFSANQMPKTVASRKGSKTQSSVVPSKPYKGIEISVKVASIKATMPRGDKDWWGQSVKVVVPCISVSDHFYGIGWSIVD